MTYEEIHEKEDTKERKYINYTLIGEQGEVRVSIQNNESDQYFPVLKINDGVIEFKTDNQLLFEFTIQEVNNTRRIIDYISLDLHNTDCTNNVMTEYEEKFSKKGNRIYKLIWNNINKK